MEFDPKATLADLIDYRTLRDFLRRRGWRFRDGFSTRELGTFMAEAQVKRESEAHYGRRYYEWSDRVHRQWEKKAKRIVLAMREAGLVSDEKNRIQGRIDRDGCLLTKEGKQLRVTSWARRLDRPKVDRRITALLERVQYVNAHPDEFYHEIALLGIFGSCIEPDRTDFGDIDVIIEIRGISSYWGDNYYPALARLWKQDHPNWQNDFDVVDWILDIEEGKRHWQPDKTAYYSYRKTRKFLKRGDGYLSLHQPDERIPTTVAVYYTRDDGLFDEPERINWLDLYQPEKDLSYEIHQ